MVIILCGKIPKNFKCDFNGAHRGLISAIFCSIIKNTKFKRSKRSILYFIFIFNIHFQKIFAQVSSVIDIMQVIRLNSQTLSKSSSLKLIVHSKFSRKVRSLLLIFIFLMQ